jgi:imidazolonepropionase-like amidohydrolase
LTGFLKILSFNIYTDMNNLWSIPKILVLCILLFVGSTQSYSQTHRQTGLRDNTPEVYAFTHARIYAAPDVVYENSTLVIRNGMIEAVGQNIQIPADAWQIDLSGKTIYPGFIESYTNLGMPDAKTIAESAEKLPQDGRHWNPQVRSHFSSSLAYSYDEKKAASLRSMGFVAAHTMSDAGVFHGSGTVIKLAEDIPSKQLIRTDFSQGLSFSRTAELDRGYPTSVMGTIALIRQSFYDAVWYDQIKNDPEQKKEVNPSVNILADALQNNTPWVIETADEQYLMRAANIAKEFSLKLWVAGSGFEYRRVEQVKNSGVALILPLNFPEKPDVQKPEESINISLENLRHWYLAPENPAILYNAGVSFAITATGIEKPNDFLKNLRIAVNRGFPREKALEALTLIPATRLGIDHLYGSLEKGKSAGFIITNGDIFDDKTKIKEVWVAGKQHKIEETDRPLEGKWLTAGGSIENITLSLQYKNNRLQGELLNQEEETIAKLENFKFENDRLSFSIPRDTIWSGMRLSATVSDDEMLGVGETASGNFFSWKAEKQPTESSDQTEKEKSEPLKSLDLPVLYPSMEYGVKNIPEQVKVLLVQNATIWTQGPDGILENTDMLLRDGKIAQIGQNLTVPANALVIDAGGRHVTPGLIDPHLHTSIAGGVNETGDAITSETRISDVIDANNVWLYRLLAGGLTTANLFHGSANPIGGQSAVIKMRWGGLPDDLWMQDAMPGLKFALGENVKRSSGRYPNSRMGTAQILEDSFLAALQYEKERAASEVSQRRDAKPFRRDLQLEPILEVLQGKRLAHVHAYRQDEMLMIMRLAEKFGFTVASFEHTVEGYKIADELREHGAAAIIWTDWSSFKVEAYDGIHQNARLLLDAGVLTSLHSDNTQLSTRMNWEAGKILRSGVGEIVAMDLLTMNPAKILRLDHRIGSLEPGKDADFVIWNGHPLSSFTTADQTWIEGRKYFDKEEDQELQQQVKKERALIIQQIIDSK